MWHTAKKKTEEQYNIKTRKLSNYSNTVELQVISFRVSELK